MKINEEIIKALKETGEYRISGVGIIKIVDRPQRTAVRPGTNERITVPARKDLAFKKSKKFLDDINGRS